MRKTPLRGVLGLLWILSPAGAGPKTATTAGGDPFIAAIEAAKRSVASLDCLSVSGSDSRILERVGTAFLLSGKGDFLTAAHVIAGMQNPQRSCPTPALTLPSGDWHPEAPTEPLRWFPFQASRCRMDPALDIAICTLSEDLAERKRDLHLKAAPVLLEWNIPRDGTQVAFTGFPLRARDPMTFRAHVAAFRTPWPDEPIPELVLDRPTLSGFSGSPVYLADGRVVAIILKDGRDEAAGVTIVRPVSVLREMLGEGSRKN